MILQLETVPSVWPPDLKVGDIFFIRLNPILIIESIDENWLLQNEVYVLIQNSNARHYRVVKNLN